MYTDLWTVHCNRECQARCFCKQIYSHATNNKPGQFQNSLSAIHPNGNDKVNNNIKKKEIWIQLLVQTSQDVKAPSSIIVQSQQRKANRTTRVDLGWVESILSYLGIKLVDKSSWICRKISLRQTRSSSFASCTACFCFCVFSVCSGSPVLFAWLSVVFDRDLVRGACTVFRPERERNEVHTLLIGKGH